jgi:hypothetical protein
VVDRVLIDQLVPNEPAPSDPWYLGENAWFDALFLVDRFAIVAAVPTLRQLEVWLEDQTTPGAPYEWAKVNRILGALAGEPRPRSDAELQIRDLARVRAARNPPAEVPQNVHPRTTRPEYHRHWVGGGVGRPRPAPATAGTRARCRKATLYAAVSDASQGSRVLRACVVPPTHMRWRETSWTDLCCFGAEVTLVRLRSLESSGTPRCAPVPSRRRRRADGTPRSKSERWAAIRTRSTVGPCASGC